MAALTLVPAPTFEAPANIRVPGVDATVKVTVTWRHKGLKEFQAWFASARGRDDAEVLSEVIVSWGAEIDQPYSRDNLAALLDAYPGASLDLLEAYREGLHLGRRKN